MKNGQPLIPEGLAVNRFLPPLCLLQLRQINSPVQELEKQGNVLLFYTAPL